MAELFATTLDVYLLVGCLPEEPDNRATADGRPATRLAAHARLARMIGADLETSTEEECKQLAERIAARQVDVIHDALKRTIDRLPVHDGPVTIFLAGEGEFLAKRVVRQDRHFPIQEIALSTMLDPAQSRAACAYAVAQLARS
jgi:uncharacterized hydantoinase/oxoprolinase family protein